MSFVVHTVDRPTRPAPLERPVPAGPLPNVSHLIVLVRWLALFGKAMVEAVRQRATDVDFPFVSYSHFGQFDVSSILYRVARGMQLAAALEEKLLGRFRRGRDLPPAFKRESETRVPDEAGSASDEFIAYSNGLKAASCSRVGSACSVKR